MHPASSEFDTPRLAQFDQGWRREILPTGLNLLHNPWAGSDNFYIGATIRAGARVEDPAHTGISHFLEHMMFRGSGLYPQFTQLAEAFEGLGGDWNAATGHEHTEYWYSGIRHSAREVITLFADFLKNPQLHDIEVERQVIQRELDGETNDRGFCTDLDYHIATLIWPNSPLAQPILGTRETLTTFQVPALRRHRAQFYTPQNTVICAVGGDTELLACMAQHFADFGADQALTPRLRYASLPTFKGPAVKWAEHSDNEYEIKVASLCDGEWSQDAPALDLIARILSDGFSSRLCRRMREELGLVYDIHASANLGIDAGTLDIHGSCTPDRLDAYFKELFSLLRQLRDEGPSAAELERAKVRALVDLELSPSHAEALGSRFAWALLCDQPYSLVKERQKILSVSETQIKDLLRQLFRPSAMAVATLGPKGREIENRIKKALISGLG